MDRFCQPLEQRTLFAAAPASLPPQYNTLVYGLKSFEANYKGFEATEYRYDLTNLTAEIKSQPRSKANATDLARFDKTIAIQAADSSRQYTRFIATLNLDIARVRAADLAEQKKPSSAHQARLSTLASALGANASAAQAKVIADITAGISTVHSAMIALIAANPSDARLLDAVQDAYGSENTVLAGFELQFDTINANITAFADAV